MKIAAWLDLKNLKELFDSCEREARVAGKGYAFAGRVRALRLTEDWTRVMARVTEKDGFSVRVELDYDPGEARWVGFCTCPKNTLCEHVAALAAELLQSKGGLIENAEVVPMPPRDLLQEARIRLGRSLKTGEMELAGLVQELYHIWSDGRPITPRHLTWVRRTWKIPDISQFHALLTPRPANAWEFWERLALALSRHGISLPEPFAEITNLESVAPQIAEAERQTNIETWRNQMRHVRQQVEDEAPAPLIDLRIAIEGDKPVFEWKEDHETGYHPLTRKHAGVMMVDDDKGILRLRPEAMLLWTAWTRHFAYRYRSSGADEQFLSLLNRLFSSSWLRERLINRERLPFRREGRNLHWKTEQGENGDYTLWLVSESGPVEHPLLALPGDPWLYLSEDELFTGPPCWKSGWFEPGSREERTVPRAAVESSEGIHFLRTIRAPLPSRLEERVKVHPMHLRFVCSLARGGVSSEYIEITVQAYGGSRLEVFRPDGWSVLEDASADDLVLHTREQCALMPGLWGELPVKYDTYGGVWRMRLSKKAPELFAGWARSLPPKAEVLAHGELATLLKEPVKADFSLESKSVDTDWFDLQVVINPSDTELTSQELKMLLEAGGRYVRIQGKGWRRLEMVLSDDVERRISELGLDARDFSAEPQRLHALQLATPAARRLLPAEQSEEIARRVRELKTRVSPPVPAAINASLRPYQVEGFHFLAYLTTNRFGGILADDMGLGKTLQALTWLAWLREGKPGASGNGGKQAPCIVVCPKSVMDNWRAEANRFVPGLQVVVWAGTDEDAFAAAAAKTDLIVINYTQMRALAGILENLTWLAAILDEGQYIKTPGSQTAQTARSLQAPHRLVLTGTPIENRLLDLWSLMAFAMPGILGSRGQFGNKFNEKRDPLARVRLSARVRPFLLRRTKQQVAPDLPDRVEEDLFCDLEGDQQTLYRSELKRAQNILLKLRDKSDFDQNRFHILTSLLRLRQICCHPRLVAPKISRKSSAKLSALLELLEPLMDEGHKVLVFSQFVSMLELIRDEVAGRSWPHFFLSGGTENRGDLVKEFQESEGPGLFLISLKAGGVGINLTAASYVVLFDPWWNPAVENQAIDRTHRIGQTNKVIAYRLVARETVEQKIRNLQASKSELARDVLSEEKFAATLTLDDFRFLLEDD